MNSIINGVLIILTVLGFGVYQAYRSAKDSAAELISEKIAYQFAEPHIQQTLHGVATSRANEIIENELRPAVKAAQQSIAQSLQPLQESITEAKAQLKLMDDEFQRERYRIRNLAIRTTLFLTIRSHISHELFEASMKTKGLTLLISKMDRKSRRLMKEITLVSQVLSSPSVVHESQDDEDEKTTTYQVVSISELVDVGSEPILGENIDKLSDFNEIWIVSPAYEKSSYDTLHSDESLKTNRAINSFWSSIKKVHLQLIVNWVPVNDVISEVRPFWSQDDSWIGIKTGTIRPFRFYGRPLSADALLQEVRSKYEQATLRRSLEATQAK